MSAMTTAITRKIVLLTGAGASKPLGLPLMADFVDEEYLRGGSDPAQIVAHLGMEWARGITRGLDFEYVYTLAHLLSDIGIESPLAYPMSPGSSVRVRWPMGQGQGTKEKDLRLHDVAPGARELRERLRGHVHDRLWNFDPATGAELYGGFLRPFLGSLGQGAVLDVFTTNYDRVVETIWEARLHDGAFGVPTVLRRGFRLVNEYSPSMEWDPSTYDQEGDGRHHSIRLFKLHGSLNWRLQRSSLLETSANEYSPRESTLIYPLQGVKDSNQEPFATLFSRWRSSVSQATDCIAIGASLRDLQVVQPLEDTANQSPDFKLWLLDPRADQVKARLPEAIRSRTVPVARLFGEPGIGEELAAAVFSEDRQLPHSPLTR